MSFIRSLALALAVVPLLQATADPSAPSAAADDGCDADVGGRVQLLVSPQKCRQRRDSGCRQRRAGAKGYEVNGRSPDGYP